jgi:peptidoglycan/xylan/chitin deacetylase (PgdA/CDA1 family)
MASTAAFAALAIIPGTLLLLGYFIYYPPKSLFDYMQRKHPGVLFQVSLPSPHRVVALTLDDCPSQHTTTMLDSLKKHNAKATFFIIGDQVPGYEDVIKRIHDDGHEVGNHAWTDEKTVLRPLAEVERQIKAVELLLPANVNGLKYFRPGGGFFSSKMVERVTGMGYKVVLGCIYPHDPQVWSPSINARHVLSMVRPGGIIIMHDRRGHSTPQLELVLKGLKDGGWDIVSIGELLKIAENIKEVGTNGILE